VGCLFFAEFLVVEDEALVVTVVKDDENIIQLRLILLHFLAVHASGDFLFLHGFSLDHFN
jgi:hypothetical protein